MMPITEFITEKKFSLLTFKIIFFVILPKSVNYCLSYLNIMLLLFSFKYFWLIGITNVSVVKIVFDGKKSFIKL